MHCNLSRAVFANCWAKGSEPVCAQLRLQIKVARASKLITMVESLAKANRHGDGEDKGTVMRKRRGKVRTRLNSSKSKVVHFQFLRRHRWHKFPPTHYFISHNLTVMLITFFLGVSLSFPPGHVSDCPKSARFNSITPLPESSTSSPIAPPIRTSPH